MVDVAGEDAVEHTAYRFEEMFRREREAPEVTPRSGPA